MPADGVVLGLAGSYCSGKSTVAQLLGERGFLEIDVDLVGHEVLREQADAVEHSFGAEVLNSEGLPDRRKLGAVVFADRSALARLEAILHPRMVELVTQRVHELQGRNCVINAALLFPMGLHDLCDHVLWVDACLPLRLLRATRRDRCSLPAAMRRIARQRRLSAKFSSAMVDTDTVRNSGSRRALEAKVDAVLRRLGTE